MPDTNADQTPTCTNAGNPCRKLDTIPVLRSWYSYDIGDLFDVVDARNGL